MVAYNLDVSIPKYTRDGIQEFTKEEVKEILRDNDIPMYSWDLICDLAAKFAGEQPLPPSVIEASIEKQLGKFLPLVPYEHPVGYRLPTGKYTKHKEDWIPKVTKILTDYARTVQEFILGIDMHVPGHTPLEKAVNVLWFMAQSEAKEDAGADGQLNFAMGIPAWAQKPRDAQAVQNSLNEKMELVQKLQFEALSDLDKNILQIDSAKPSPEEIFRSMYGIAETILKAAMKVKHEGNLFVTDAKDIYKGDGGVIHQRKAKGINDLRGSKRAPTKGHINNLVLGKRKVDQEYQVVNKLPLVICICDVSGSMSDGVKQYQALGIIKYLVEQADKGDLHLYFSFFESKNYGFTHVHSAMNPTAWFEEIRKTSFNKGVTDIGTCAVDAIKKAKKFVEDTNLEVDNEQVNLVLINDGQDDATPLTHEVLDQLNAKLHGYILQSENEHIKKLCAETGGYYTERL